MGRKLLLFAGLWGGCGGSARAGCENHLLTCLFLVYIGCHKEEAHPCSRKGRSPEAPSCAASPSPSSHAPSPFYSLLGTRPQVVVPAQASPEPQPEGEFRVKSKKEKEREKKEKEKQRKKEQVGVSFFFVAAYIDEKKTR
jgi:hypothetical protein